MKEKLIKVLLFVAVVLTVCACGKKTDSESDATTKSGNSQNITVRVGSLKGPTSIGITEMMNSSENSRLENDYEFVMKTQPDELLAMITSGELDIALVPANMASIIYNKTVGKVKVIDINTLGVLYFVSGNDEVNSIEDLHGKSIYLTGKGTTPDYVLQFLLKSWGIDDAKLEYKSEATEVASVLANDSNAIGFLQQPFVTSVMTANPSAEIKIDATKEWDKLCKNEGSRLVTGVTIVRTEFLEQNEAAVLNFMADHEQSVKFVNGNVDEAARYCQNYSIIEKEEVALKAIPYCNIVYVDGNEMKNALSGYLKVLYEYDNASVGGTLPGDDFYYENSN